MNGISQMEKNEVPLTETQTGPRALPIPYLFLMLSSKLMKSQSSTIPGTFHIHFGGFFVVDSESKIEVPYFWGGTHILEGVFVDLILTYS